MNIKILKLYLNFCHIKNKYPSWAELKLYNEYVKTWNN